MESNEALKNADEELKETHVELLARFYKLFESVHRYVTDLNGFLQDLDDGKFIQNSLESVFLDMDGKQLLVRISLKYSFDAIYSIFYLFQCESLFLYGVMLLLVDFHIEGSVREKLLVAYFRYSGKSLKTSFKVKSQRKDSLLWQNID